MVSAARPSYPVQPHYSDMGKELNLKFVLFSVGQLTTAMREKALEVGSLPVGFDTLQLIYLQTDDYGEFLMDVGVIIRAPKLRPGGSRRGITHWELAVLG